MGIIKQKIRMRKIHLWRFNAPLGNRKSACTDGNPYGRAWNADEATDRALKQATFSKAISDFQEVQKKAQQVVKRGKPNS